MGDLKVNSIQPFSLPQSEKGASTNAPPGSDFKRILSNSIKEVNELQTQANESVQKMVLGKTDIHTAMIDMEKAGISFRLMMAVRNKMISAYEEVMRMQI
jgi:flagellar hook-basal body complex protein FliE